MEDHKTHDQLLNEIEEAKKKVELGLTYVHYKDAKKLYKPIRFGTLEANDELCVIYEAQYGPGLTFIRPVKEWVESINWNGRLVKRFKKI